MDTYEFDPANGAEFYYFKWVEAEAALASERRSWDLAYAKTLELREKLAAAEQRVRELEDEIAGVHHYLLEMFEFFWHDGNSRTHLNVVEWLERPHTTPWMNAVDASEGRSMARLTTPEPKEET